MALDCLIDGKEPIKSSNLEPFLLQEEMRAYPELTLRELVGQKNF
jgi:hypothetical protein